MIDHLIEQLDDSDKDVRKQAIISLGRSKDKAALPYLADVFRTDPEPELRELARKAGAFIRQQNGEAPASAAPSAPPPSVPAEPERQSSLQEDGSVRLRVYETPKPQEEAPKPQSDIPTRGREYTVTKQNRDRAKNLVEFALGSNLNGDNAGAMKYLAQALRLDPNLINDDYYASIASTVTGESGDEAIRMVVDGETRKGFVKAAQTQKKEKIKSEHLEKAKQTTLTGEGFEYVLFLIINILFPFLSTIVVIEISRSVFSGLLTQAVSLADTPQEQQAIGALTVQFDALVGSLGYFALFVSSVVTGIGSLASASLHALVNHYLAKAFGGVGTFSHLISSLFAYYNRWIPILYVVSTVWIVMIIVTYGSVVFAGLGGLVMAYVSFRSLSRVSRVVAEAYNLSFVSGCLTYIASNVVLFIIFFVLGLMLGGIFGSFASSMLPPDVLQTLGAPRP